MTNDTDHQSDDYTELDATKAVNAALMRDNLRLKAVIESLRHELDKAKRTIVDFKISRYRRTSWRG